MLLAVQLTFGWRVGGDFAFASADFADRQKIVETTAPGIDPKFADFSQLFPARCLKGVARMFRGFVRGVGHDGVHAVFLTSRIATF
jgi:hypothetical protein